MKGSPCELEIQFDSQHSVDGSAGVRAIVLFHQNSKSRMEMILSEGNEDLSVKLGAFHSPLRLPSC